jgi:cysteinyl-tRNA synthetase
MLRFFSTLSRMKEPFRPRDQGVVKIFCCGPSVYQRPHIGNFRTFVYQDIVQRYLEYLGYRVERAISITDVEDKAIDEAQRQGVTLEELTDIGTSRFFRDAQILRIKPPAHLPRASATVHQAVAIIQALVDRGYAYWHHRDVFFDPLTFKGFGKLYRLDMKKWPREVRRYRKDTYRGNRWNLGDFILWHGYREGDAIFWDTDIGRGRPAWNIQDPAMITASLGYTVDISCGGVDNLFRHHDYTLAIMEALSQEEFARYWFHGEHLLVDGKKMSKSRGNIVYLETLLDQGYRPDQVRFFLCREHYRTHLNLTDTEFATAVQKLTRFQEMVRILSYRAESSTALPSEEDAEHPSAGLESGFRERMDDDLDLKGAFEHLSVTVAMLVEETEAPACGIGKCRQAIRELRSVDRVLQFIFAEGDRTERVWEEVASMTVSSL